MADPLLEIFAEGLSLSTDELNEESSPDNVAAWDSLAAMNLVTLIEDTAPGGGGGGAVDSVNGHTGVVVLVKADVGLSNVDNTSDANKPVSTAQGAADAAVASTAQEPARRPCHLLTSKACHAPGAG